MDFPPWDWDVTWAELIFLAEGEVGVEAEVWNYDCEKPELRAAWPDDGEIENFRVCLFEIDGHAVADTLDEYRAYIAGRISQGKDQESRALNWQLERPWIAEWVNLWRVVNGPNNSARNDAIELAKESLGLRFDAGNEIMNLADFDIHPRLKVATLRQVPRYRRPRGRPTVPVPWGSNAAQAAMNDIRKRCSNGVEIADAARQCAKELEGNVSDDRPKDLAKLYRKKISLRGNIADVLAGE